MNIPDNHPEPTRDNIPEAGKDIISRIPNWAPVAVVAFTAILYSQAIFNGFTSFDDDFYILNNPFLRDFTWHGVKAIFTSFYSSNYHPFTTLSNLLEYKFFGLKPLPYHLLNVALHLINTWFVFLLAERLSGKKITALVVSVLFAVHPMHVESVAWVAERKDVLYSFFYLSSLVVYLRYLESGFRSKYYVGMFLLFLASVCSKSAAVSLPVLLVAVDIYKGRAVNVRSLVEKIPLFLLSVLFGVLNIMAQAAGGSINNIATSFGFINRIFLLTSAIAAYIIRLVAPYRLSAMHYFPVMTHALFPWIYYASLPLVLLLGWLAIRRSALRKEIVFGASFFLITIFLMLQIVSVGSAHFAERYTYISYIGLFYIAGQGIASINDSKWQRVTLVMMSLIVIIFSIETWDRIQTWKDDTVLFNDLINKNPNVYFGYWMRGNFEKHDGNLQAALDDYNTSIRLDSSFDDAFFNRGIVYDVLGNTKAAIHDYTSSIRINPKLPDVYNNRGWAHFVSGDTSLAILDLNKAIALKPTYTLAYNNRGWVYLQSGKTKEALSDFNKAFVLDSNFDKPLYNMAGLKENTGDYAGAIKDFDHILTRYPKDANTYYFRGIAYLNLKDTVVACKSWEQAAGLGNQQALQLLSKYAKVKRKYNE
jgi:tetratricopeptide (TPR) repeat protein